MDDCASIRGARPLPSQVKRLAALWELRAALERSKPHLISSDKLTQGFHSSRVTNKEARSFNATCFLDAPKATRRGRPCEGFLHVYDSSNRGRADRCVVRLGERKDSWADDSGRPRFAGCGRGVREQEMWKMYDGWARFGSCRDSRLPGADSLLGLAATQKQSCSEAAALLSPCTKTTRRNKHGVV